MVALLFPKADLPRRAPVKRMRVADAGHFPSGGKCIQFVCPRCGHDTGWIADEWTVTENRNGRPCPSCNKTT
jgi:rubrerythrin